MDPNLPRLYSEEEHKRYERYGPIMWAVIVICGLSILAYLLSMILFS